MVTFITHIEYSVNCDGPILLKQFFSGNYFVTLLKVAIHMSIPV